MQIIAALVLTEEEIAPLQRKDYRGHWQEGMKRELLSDEWRPQLLAALKTQGFLTNSHPGFPLGPLLTPIPSLWDLQRAYADLENLIGDYANGDEPIQPDVRAYFSGLLQQKGYSPEVAEFCMENSGYSLALEAQIEKIMRKK
jgi:hypothetical protein